MSVECVVGLSVAELAIAIPHSQLGVTTVGAVRREGGDVVRTTGRSPYHATFTGLTPEQASRLLTPATLILLGEHTAGRPFVSNPKVFADFHNADTRGRLRLNCIGTIKDLARQQIVLRDGVCLILYSEELEVGGVVEYSTDEHLWVAVIDWHAIKDTGPQAIGPEG